MNETVSLHVRIDNETKDRASETLATLGLSMSEAVRVFLRRVAADQALPFELKVPNATTRAAMAEARTIHRGRFESAAGLIDDLAKNVG